MDKKNIWFITAKTNLHVGNENTSSYGLIDLAVQRNVTTGLPCINSSSLKGALNEYASQFNDLDRFNIFGSDKLDRNKGSEKGKYTFFDANILFLPVQSDEVLYKLVTCEAVMTRFINQVKLLTGITFNKQEVMSKFNCAKEISNKEFENLCSDDNLPIIARNVLENGESKNLWYEQVVPAETVFYTIIVDRGDGMLAGKISEDNAIVQIGANATIGYGYCKFTNL